MSDDFRLRRRLTPSGPRRSPGGNNWLITIVAAIVVIAVGWFAGTMLARYSSGKAKQVAQVATAAPVPSPTQAPTATPAPSPSPTKAPATPKPKPSASPPATAAPTAAPTTKPTAAPTASPAPRSTSTPHPVTTARPVMRPATPAPARRVTQPVARKPEPVVPPDQVAAESIVRAYVDAMRRGSPEAAGIYLANGSPDETFIGSSTSISSLSASRNSDGTYSVTVHMQTADGRYIETFIVAATPEGERILNKNASKL